jgi:hypothetical protein
MATGPSGRYSPHFSKSTLVASAVELFLVPQSDDLIEQVSRLRAFLPLDFVAAEFVDDQ